MTVAFDPINVPHLALPLAIGPGGTFNTVQQDTIEEVTQSVGVLLGTFTGERLMVPSYGIEDPTFSDPNPNEIVQAVTQWEPRAAVTATVSVNQRGVARPVVKVRLSNPS